MTVIAGFLCEEQKNHETSPNWSQDSLSELSQIIWPVNLYPNIYGMSISNLKDINDEQYIYVKYYGLLTFALVC